MAKNIYSPAGMTHSGPDHQFIIIPGRARWYMALSEDEWEALPAGAREQVSAGQVFNAALHDTSMKRAGGGLLSTARDLVRFAIAVMDGRLVKPETLAQMWSPQTTTTGEKVTSPWGDIGLGWMIRERDSRREIYTSGGQVGTRATMYIYPEDGIVLAIMCNLENAPIDPMLDEILVVLFAKAR